MELNNFNQWLETNVGDNVFIFQMFLAVFITLLVNFIWRRVYRKLHQQLKKTKNEWDDALIIAISAPVTLLIWGAGGWIIINELLNFSLQDKIRAVFIVAIVSWFLVRFISNGEKNLISNNEIGRAHV